MKKPMIKIGPSAATIGSILLFGILTGCKVDSKSKVDETILRSTDDPSAAVSTSLALPSSVPIEALRGSTKTIVKKEPGTPFKPFRSLRGGLGIFTEGAAGPDGYVYVIVNDVIKACVPDTFENHQDCRLVSLPKKFSKAELAFDFVALVNSDPVKYAEIAFEKDLDLEKALREALANRDAAQKKLDVKAEIYKPALVRVTDAQTQIDNTRNEIPRAEGLIKNSREKLRNAQLEFNAKNTELSDLNATLDRYEKLRRSLSEVPNSDKLWDETQYQNAKSKQSNLQTSVDRLSNFIRDLTRTIDETQKKVDQLTSDLPKLILAKKELEESIGWSAIDSEYRTAQAELNQAEHAVRLAKLNVSLGQSAERFLANLDKYNGWYSLVNIDNRSGEYVILKMLADSQNHKVITTSSEGRYDTPEAWIQSNDVVRWISGFNPDETLYMRVPGISNWALTHNPTNMIVQPLFFGSNSPRKIRITYQVGSELFAHTFDFIYPAGPYLLNRKSVPEKDAIPQKIALESPVSRMFKIHRGLVVQLNNGTLLTSFGQDFSKSNTFRGLLPEHGLFDMNLYRHSNTVQICFHRADSTLIAVDCLQLSENEDSITAGEPKRDHDKASFEMNKSYAEVYRDIWGNPETFVHGPVYFARTEGEGIFESGDRYFGPEYRAVAFFHKGRIRLFNDQKSGEWKDHPVAKLQNVEKFLPYLSFSTRGSKMPEFASFCLVYRDLNLAQKQLGCWERNYWMTKPRIAIADDKTLIHDVNILDFQGVNSAYNHTFKASLIGLTAEGRPSWIVPEFKERFSHFPPNGD